jgi:WD40 repeat protein/DNA-directed RNA polymerase specialized sigma24 family protein
VTQDREDVPLNLPLGAPIGDIQDHDQVLAFSLENAQPGDPNLVDTLLETFGSDIARLTYAVLDQDWMKPPRKEDVLAQVQNIFASAGANIADFIGHESIRIWLYALAIRELPLRYKRPRRREPQSLASKSPHTNENPQPTDSLQAAFWSALDELPSRQHLVLVLKHAMMLSDAEVAATIGTSRRKAWKTYLKALHDLKSKLGDNLFPVSVKTRHHPRILKKIQTLEFDADQSNYAVRKELQVHVDACEGCQAYIQAQKRFMSALVMAMRARWPPQKIELTVVRREALASMDKRMRARAQKGLLPWMKELGLLGLTTVAVLALIFFLNRTNPQPSQRLFPPTPGPPPSPLEIASTSRLINVSGQGLGVSLTPAESMFIAEPSLSSNGNFLAFSSSISTFVEGDANGASDIFVLDRQANSVTRVSVAADGSDADGWSSSPSISVDGRWIVFASSAKNLVAKTGSAPNPEQATLVNSAIYIYDRNEGSTAQISLAPDGGEPNGGSFLPTISADGRWIIYWSEATNLIADGPVLYAKVEGQSRRTDAFVYDRDSGVTTRIPIGRDANTGYFEPVSTSRDGRYLAFTILESDLIAVQLQVTSALEAFVYDQQTADYEPLNLASDGTPGNGASFNPHLSAQGQIVVFASEATNLVDQDENGRADVFVRDRFNGTTERVSVASDGSEANAESGTRTLPGVFGWGDQVSISDDGRYVIFMSHASNLSPTFNTLCGHPGLVVCRSIYVHDRQTATTELVILGPERDSFFLHLQLSGDGSTLSVLEKFFRCLDNDTCSELWLYNLKTGKTVNPIRGSNRAGQYGLAGWPGATIQTDSAVRSLAFSPDNRTLAIGQNDATVRLYRTSYTGSLLALEGHNLPVSSLVFSRDGNYLFTGSHDGRLNVWRVEGGALVSRLLDGPDAILGLALSPDGRFLAAGGYRWAWLWEVGGEKFRRVGVQEYPGSFVNDLVFSPDGDLLILAVSDGTIWIRRVPNGEILYRLGGQTEKALAVAISPDGRYVASGSEDHKLNLWRLQKSFRGDLEVSHVFTIQYPNWVSDLAFTPDGSVLASASLDNDVRMWQIPSGDLIEPSPHIRRDEILTVAISPNGRILAAGTIGRAVHFWDLSPPFLTETYEWNGYLPVEIFLNP